MERDVTTPSGRSMRDGGAQILAQNACGRLQSLPERGSVCIMFWKVSAVSANCGYFPNAKQSECHTVAN